MGEPLPYVEWAGMLLKRAKTYIHIYENLSISSSPLAATTSGCLRQSAVSRADLRSTKALMSCDSHRFSLASGRPRGDNFTGL